MKYEFKFQKILNLKEREKDEALGLYQDSVEKFEAAAEKLFDLLKKKEDLELYQSQKISSGLSIREIRHYQQFILNMEKTIDHFQKVVMNARNKMNWCEEKLKESNIEMKKYENLKEKSHKNYLHMINETENIQLDEISALQYFHRGGN
ncbi:flagellar export protein FliJ [Lederbergia citrea]|uniref:Flagellar FliJ protein n=1 Tax=Lederbergia citrea TaxID=2833581 RepID=A0A942UHM1_9BACI|nr:flagellar export protein FliJ [Lederbergia citrea]MBS4177121.1 flagellar biosynthesis chaperone FliJ [Lederbergia citrea]MBS4203784.1 flagellar biosynthesis chaperone FliJ [Lederbergia citrea]MBS4221631.1 flagellar biosynthesis chaperone FliJ [Lederbergia citrea]